MYATYFSIKAKGCASLTIKGAMYEDSLSIFGILEI